VIIGKHYNYDNYNCAHFVSDWYKEKLNIEIPITNQFDMSFVRWLRKNFTEIDKPINNCLVVMKDKKLNHIGVYSDYGVYHNYQVSNKHGSVQHWPLGVVKRNFKKVTYWKWLK